MESWYLIVGGLSPGSVDMKILNLILSPKPTYGDKFLVMVSANPLLTRQVSLVFPELLLKIISVLPFYSKSTFKFTLP